MRIRNFIGHLSTVTRHRNAVIRHCRKAGIFWQGLRHDLSKFSPQEFISGVRYYQGTRSPNEQERQEKGYSSAWMHHKGRNRHHFEYWTDYSTATRRVEPVKMPLRWVIEMFCDRVAACKIYNGSKYQDSDPLAYFERGKPGRIIHPETSAFLESLLRMLAEEGEEQTFAHIRRILREKREY
ncbi:MAG: catalase [Oscillospiraceae bacterium]|nr:catalase [Oscillospiraceae bacterium]